MNRTGYKILGLVVWRGGRWYLRRHTPSRRKLLVALAALVGAGVLARRLAA
ncbi:MAG TPA: hypothetical protein VN672_09435 [Solirubrobacteraceae bacterium]|nr:hypothetical protein [Solirubrobacteraceae bacterium]